MNGESMEGFYYFFLKLFCIFYNDLFVYQNNHMYTDCYTQPYMPKE